MPLSKNALLGRRRRLFQKWFGVTELTELVIHHACLNLRRSVFLGLLGLLSLLASARLPFKAATKVHPHLAGKVGGEIEDALDFDKGTAGADLGLAQVAFTCRM